MADLCSVSLGLSGDPLRLKQILANLVSNAIKFTNEGSVSVRVMLEQEEETYALLRISVTDTGIGLSAAQQKSLFQAFSQADNSLSRQSGGTGLGLVISKRLVEQMQGEIGLHSQLGEGSEFWLTLRLAKSSQALDDLPRHPLAGKRAALVEPQILSRQALLHSLEDLGLSTTLYETVQDVHLALENGAEVDLVLLSVRQTAADTSELRDLVALWAEQQRCKTVLFTDTTEHYPALDDLPRSQCQVLSKPVCTRKLFRAASHLLLRPHQSAPQIRQETPAGSPLVRVLCVDDNLANLKLVETLLTDMGAEVLTATSGEEALDLLDHQAVGLIFMDVQMPGMDGRQTTAELRGREQAAGVGPVPIVALTAHALAGERRQLLTCGMNDYMGKPINPEQLRHCVRKHTGVTLNPLPEPPVPEGEQPAVALERPNAAPKTLDIEEGIRLAAGKRQLADDMLSMLINSLPEEKRRIEQANAAGDRDALLEAVHKLHGATRYCGVPELRECCQRCETRIKRNEDFAACITELLAAADRLLICYSELAD